MINKDKWEKLTERMVNLHITETELVEKFIVGSGKGGHIFDGQRHQIFDPEGLSKFLRGRSAPALIAWDAPLTGPTSIEGPILPKDLTERIIEFFFLKNKKNIIQE